MSGVREDFYAPIKRTKKTSGLGEEIEVNFPMLKQYCVFNAEQVELPDNFDTWLMLNLNRRTASSSISLLLKQRFGATGATIMCGGDRCSYSPSTDHIQNGEETPIRVREGVLCRTASRTVALERKAM